MKWNVWWTMVLRLNYYWFSFSVCIFPCFSFFIFRHFEYVRLCVGILFFFSFMCWDAERKWRNEENGQWKVRKECFPQTIRLNVCVLSDRILIKMKRIGKEAKCNKSWHLVYPKLLYIWWSSFCLGESLGEWNSKVFRFLFCFFAPVLSKNHATMLVNRRTWLDELNKI